MNKNVKVFVLADRDLSEGKTRIMDYGADGFAVKPLSTESLINKINLKLLEVAKSAPTPSSYASLPLSSVIATTTTAGANTITTSNMNGTST